MVSRLAWSPHWLAHTAARCSMARAAGLGFVAVGVPVVAPVAAQIGSISEPYRDLTDYVHESLAAAPFVLVIALAVWCLYALACDLVAARAHADLKMPLRNALLLAPVTVLVPAAAWSVFAALAIFADPANGFYSPGGKPAWLTSPAILIFGSPLWIAVGVAVITANAHAARRHLQDITAGHRCRHCYYNLTGNVSGICPECGTAVACAANEHQTR